MVSWKPYATTEVRGEDYHQFTGMPPPEGMRVDQGSGQLATRETKYAVPFLTQPPWTVKRGQYELYNPKTGLTQPLVAVSTGKDEEPYTIPPKSWLAMSQLVKEEIGMTPHNVRAEEILRYFIIASPTGAVWIIDLLKLSQERASIQGRNVRTIPTRYEESLQSFAPGLVRGKETQSDIVTVWQAYTEEYERPGFISVRLAAFMQNTQNRFHLWDIFDGERDSNLALFNTSGFQFIGENWRERFLNRGTNTMGFFFCTSVKNEIAPWRGQGDGNTQEPTEFARMAQYAVSLQDLNVWSASMVTFGASSMGTLDLTLARLMVALGVHQGSLPRPADARSWMESVWDPVTGPSIMKFYLLKERILAGLYRDMTLLITRPDEGLGKIVNEGNLGEIDKTYHLAFQDFLIEQERFLSHLIFRAAAPVPVSPKLWELMKRRRLELVLREDVVMRRATAAKSQFEGIWQIGRAHV
jgi:hypothetical protein